MQAFFFGLLPEKKVFKFAVPSDFSYDKGMRLREGFD
jgi:hypothetical protein